MTLRFIDFKTSKQQPATSPSVVSTGLKTQGRTTQPNRISKNRFAPGLRSHFGGVGLLSLFLNGQNSLFDVGRSMFDVHFLVNSSYETTLPKFLFRLDRPFFWPAAGLTPEHCW